MTRRTSSRRGHFQHSTLQNRFVNKTAVVRQTGIQILTNGVRGVVQSVKNKAYSYANSWLGYFYPASPSPSPSSSSSSSPTRVSSVSNLDGMSRLERHQTRQQQRHIKATTNSLGFERERATVTKSSKLNFTAKITKASLNSEASSVKNHSQATENKPNDMVQSSPSTKKNDFKDGSYTTDNMTKEKTTKLSMACDSDNLTSCSTINCKEYAQKIMEDLTCQNTEKKLQDLKNIEQTSKELANCQTIYFNRLHKQKGDCTQECLDVMNHESKVRIGVYELEAAADKIIKFKNKNCISSPKPFSFSPEPFNFSPEPFDSSSESFDSSRLYTNNDTAFGLSFLGLFFSMLSAWYMRKCNSDCCSQKDIENGNCKDEQNKQNLSFDELKIINETLLEQEKEMSLIQLIENEFKIKTEMNTFINTFTNNDSPAMSTIKSKIIEIKEKEEEEKYDLYQQEKTLSRDDFTNKLQKIEINSRRTKIKLIRSVKSIYITELNAAIKAKGDTDVNKKVDNHKHEAKIKFQDKSDVRFFLKQCVKNENEDPTDTKCEDKYLEGEYLKGEGLGGDFFIHEQETNKKIKFE